jgi:NAD(P)H-hydrate epimerase
MIIDNRSSISELRLMETAGSAAAAWILNHGDSFARRRALIVCGKGNNGGDGLVVARILIEAGWTVDVVLSNPTAELSRSGLVNFNRLMEIQSDKCAWYLADDPTIIDRHAKDADLIVDALLGTGITGAIRGVSADLLKAMNRTKLPIIAMDVPSGLNSDTGMCDLNTPTCITTFNFGTRKRGCYFGDGPDRCGEIVIVDLGFPKEIVQGSEWLINPKSLTIDTPKRGYKYDGNSVIIIGGNPGMVGAPILAARSAWSLGLGDVRVIYPRALSEAFHVHLPFLATHPVGSSADDHFTPAMADAVLDILHRRESVLLIGPGMGRDAETQTFIIDILSKFRGKVVIDADAIIALKSIQKDNSNTKRDWIITPHEGELRALDPNMTDRVESASRTAVEYGCTVLSKGHPSVTVTPGGHRFVTGFDTRVFNKVGYGDVLAGLTAGYWSMGGSPEACAIAAQQLSFDRFKDAIDSGKNGDPWPISLPDGYDDIPNLKDT